MTPVAHHASTGGVAVELALVLGALALLGLVAWRERRRRGARDARRVAPLRDDDAQR